MCMFMNHAYDHDDIQSLFKLLLLAILHACRHIQVWTCDELDYVYIQYPHFVQNSHMIYLPAHRTSSLRKVKDLDAA